MSSFALVSNRIAFLLFLCACILACVVSASGQTNPSDPVTPAAESLPAATSPTGSERNSETRHPLVKGLPTSLIEGLRLQIALERAGFSPGLLDGSPGPKTFQALTDFAKAHKLPPPPAPAISALSPALQQALALDGPTSQSGVLMQYVVTSNDLAEVTGPTPTTWLGKSKSTKLGYETLSDLLAEKHHTTKRLLARLNEGVNIDQLTPGQSLIVTRPDSPALPPVARLEVHLDGKTIRGYDANGNQVLLLHCSIARTAEKRPSRDGAVAVIAENPDYTFDPARWPDVKENITRKLRIVPGPRNPVGAIWIGLDLPGYGIHGTPTPELIGKTGSAGCLRLTNWDARRLAFAVSIGTPVTFVR